MKVYLDTSAVLRVLLGQERALAGWGKWDAAFSSEIMGLEARRVIDRIRLENLFDDRQVADSQDELARMEGVFGRIPLTRAVLRRAALPMATVVRTLDAIHLASALLFQERRGERLIFATHDSQQGTAARALGFECIGV